jgi:hypothetical protein
MALLVAHLQQRLPSLEPAQVWAHLAVRYDLHDINQAAVERVWTREDQGDGEAEEDEADPQPEAVVAVEDFALPEAWTEAYLAGGSASSQRTLKRRK